MEKYSCYFTSQLTKKHKNWKDGVLVVTSRQASLYEGEKVAGACVDMLFLGVNQKIEEGEELKLDRHLVEVIGPLNPIQKQPSSQTMGTPLTTSLAEAPGQSKAPSRQADALRKRKHNGGKVLLRKKFKPPRPILQHTASHKPKNVSNSHTARENVASNSHKPPKMNFRRSPSNEPLEEPSGSPHSELTERIQASENQRLEESIFGGIAKRRRTHVPPLAANLGPDRSSGPIAILPEHPGTRPPRGYTMQAAGNECHPFPRTPLEVFGLLKKVCSIPAPSQSQPQNWEVHTEFVDGLQSRKPSAPSNAFSSLGQPVQVAKPLGVSDNSDDEEGSILGMKARATKPAACHSVLQNRVVKAKPSLARPRSEEGSNIGKPRSSYPTTPGISNTFSSLHQYKQVYLHALRQLVQVGLDKLVSAFGKVSSDFQTQHVGPNAATKARAPSLQIYARTKNIPFYDCSVTTLLRSNGRDTIYGFMGGNKWKGRRSKARQASEDNGMGDCSPQKSKFYLKVPNSSSREHYTKYSQGDIWLVSSSASFEDTRGNFVTWFSSVYHGFTSAGLMEIALLDLPGNKVPSSLKKLQNVFAIRGPNFNSEINMLENVASLSEQACPVLPWIVLGASCPQKASCILERLISSKSPSNLEKISRSCQELRDETRAAFNLNADQAQVLAQCSCWLDPMKYYASSASPPSPIQLVHGTFGAGKTYLLVALVMFMCHFLSKVDKKKNIRIMIASQTNVAVDSILLGLQAQNFEDFARVGSLRRIAKPILKHVLHNVPGAKNYEEADKAVVKELTQLMQEIKSKSQAEQTGFPWNQPAQPNAETNDERNEEIRHIQEALKDIKEQKSMTRARRLREMRVVGVTCAATAFEVLKGSKFSILLLDECSQSEHPMISDIADMFTLLGIRVSPIFTFSLVIEPLSLLPISRFSSHVVLAVGDPRQLPPTLAGSSPSKPGIVCGSLDDTSLSKTMFVRLTGAGVDPIMLHTQYRCHPLIAAVPNRLFYESTLVDGVTAEQRKPLLFSKSGRPLPPLCFLDTRGSQTGSGRNNTNGSLSNEVEAHRATKLVEAMLGQGLLPSQIGVIALYRSQAWRIQRSVSQLIVCIEQTHEEDEDGCFEDSEELKRSRKASDATKLRKMFGAGVQVSTVDAFQGGEKDVIILSCVRTNGVGFIDSPNRMNVALSRARHHLVILGSSNTLQESIIWKQVILAAKRIPNGFHPPSARDFFES